MLSTTILSFAALISGTVAFPALHTPLQKQAAGASAPRLVEYVQTFHNTSGGHLPLLSLLNKDTRLTHVNLAALHVNGPGDIHLNDVSPNDTSFDQLWTEVTKLQAGGIQVLFMMGGAAKGSYANLCGSDVPAVINESNYGPLLSTIKYHKIDGLDLDIEEAVDISCPLALLRRLNADLGKDFLLTMAPVASALQPGAQGLSGFDYVDMDKQATDCKRPNDKLVSWYNAQFYNGWGDASNPSFYEQVISSGNWSAARINLGVLDNSNDGGSGFVPLVQLENVVAQLAATYQPFGGVSGWEYFDAGKGDGDAHPWQWVKAVGHALFNGALSKSKRFATTSDKPTEPPFSEAHTALVSSGADHFDAIWALNTTNGDLHQAAEKLRIDV